jgi:hypothetical protein
MPRHRANPTPPPDPTPDRRRRPRALPWRLALTLLLALAAGACTSGGGSDTGSSTDKGSTAATMPAGPACIKPDNAGGCLPIAPAGNRVDLVRPTFSNPTSITNPLHPSSGIAQVIYGGQVDGKPFRTEFSRLPDLKTITWNGQPTKTLTMQYLAYLDGRIQEVALDWFAQADDGGVWYFGEDVFNYDNGVVADTEGTWLAGKEGPAAMIMPAAPEVGATYRPENAPEVVFEEVTVKAVGQTVPGPTGPIKGAMVVSQLHTDGRFVDKVFAPGYGEFSTSEPNGDVEAATLAVPTDARPGPMPSRLAGLSAAVARTFDVLSRNDWAGASAAGEALAAAWEAYRSGQVPELLARQMGRDLDTLAKAIAARQPAPAHQAVLRVAQNDLDFQLRHRPVVEVDRDRLELWARQLLVDVADRDPGAVAGDVATLGGIADRVRHTLDRATAARLDAQLEAVEGAAKRSDLAAAGTATRRLQATLAAI